jgi:hypothetical protein
MNYSADDCFYSCYDTLTALTASCSFGGSSQTCLSACLNPRFFFSTLGTMLLCGDVYSATGASSTINQTYFNAPTDMMNSCMTQYCDAIDPSLVGCPFKNVTHSDTLIHWLVGSRSCANIVTTVNSDPGGIGVSLLIFTSPNFPVANSRG